MRYGFVIDQNRCIGCHACTVACKEEHNVPIGVNRTWVKYIEKGEFPDTKRHFAVLRCNHCDDAPCMTICPTVALFRRPNGIVDFDNNLCIGCKSCMQACPYDALYIEPNSQTAAKCNFCAHRIEIGLKPSCEIICPTQAILSGDLDDPASEISNVVATQEISVRKPEKETKPKLFYVGVDGDLLQPMKMEPQSAHLWGDKQQGEDQYDLSMENSTSNPGGDLEALLDEKHSRHKSGYAREVYDVPHPQLWGKMIASYLWTKSIAAGTLMIAAVLLGLDYKGETLLNVISPVLALVFTGLTVLLLVFDLKRPERFFYILTKPNPRSWLVIGGYILFLYGGLAGIWLVFGFTQSSVPDLVFWLTAILAIGSAGYSAFLFAQAKGRDLWQSRLFFWHLVIQAVIAGAATLIVFGVMFPADTRVNTALTQALGISLVVGMVLILAEVFLPSENEEVRRAISLLKKGALSGRFWGQVIVVGIVLPLIFLFLPDPGNTTIQIFHISASILALFGLWVFEDLWIKAGQAVPLS